MAENLQKMRQTKPELIATDDSVALAIAALQKSIYDHPDTYLVALSSVGDIATTAAAATDESARSSNEDSEIDGDAAGRLARFFHHRYDLNVDFDHETQEGLMADPAYAEARRQHVAASESRSTQRKEAARDAARYAQLRFFVGQVALWQKQEKPATWQSAS